jgi:hypothetical protein
MFAAADVPHPPSGGARAALVLAPDPADVDGLDLLIIDGYVTLDPGGTVP